jgi:hypothetical protein
MAKLHLRRQKTNMIVKFLPRRKTMTSTGMMSMMKISLMMIQRKFTMKMKTGRRRVVIRTLEFQVNSSSRISKRTPSIVFLSTNTMTSAKSASMLVLSSTQEILSTHQVSRYSKLTAMGTTTKSLRILDFLYQLKTLSLIDLAY